MVSAASRTLVPALMTVGLGVINSWIRTSFGSFPSATVWTMSASVMTVDTRDATWVVPPQRAVWMPPQVEHRLATKGVLQLRSLYIRPDAAARG